MNKKIQVLYVEPMQEPQLREIELTLDSIQMLVGGYFEVAYPFDDPVVLVCNEEGKYNGMLPNRAIINDIIYGPFFIAGIGKDNFESIPNNLIQKYTEFFSNSYDGTRCGACDFMGRCEGLCRFYEQV